MLIGLKVLLTSAMESEITVAQNSWCSYAWRMENERMAPQEMAADPVTNCAIVYVFFALFVTYFVDNVSATVSYDQKEFLDIRTAITHSVLEEFFFFNE
jgi:hypothetical protein